MDRDTTAQPNEWNGGDELPDVPDAGDDAQPLLPPEPLDFSTSTIAADGAQLAGTLGDDRTLYEQALEVFEDDRETSEAAAETPPDAQSPAASDDRGGAGIHPN